MGSNNFLSDLGDQLSQQFSMGENRNRTMGEGYSSLGEFANNFDQSAERRYLEEGYLKNNPYNIDVKQLEILMQEPNATILLKKAMFSSLSQNYRTEYMDKDEKLFYRASKFLFQNKCTQISAYEKLTKIQKVSSIMGRIDEQLLPLIFSLIDEFEGAGAINGAGALGSAIGSSSGNSTEVSNTYKIIDKIRKAYAFSRTAKTTTWLTDATSLFQSQLGEGTGVIEITNFAEFSTSNSNTLDGNSFNINISDPYELMVVNEIDIEKAISNATNLYNQHAIFNLTVTSQQDLISEAQSQLNTKRQARGVSPIILKVNPETLLGRKVTAIIDGIGVEIPFQYNESKGIFGQGVSVPSDYLIGGAAVGSQGLDNGNGTTKSNTQLGIFNKNSELDSFNKYISATYTLIMLEQNSRNATTQNNQFTNYVRRKMMFYFLGKLIFQPMDQVHFYISSKSQYDVKVDAGLKSTYNIASIFGSLEKTLNDFKMNTPFNSIDLLAEKALFVGSDCPTFIWSMIRRQFVNEIEGTHVFAGLVTNASESFNGSKFSANISGDNNSFYLKLGKVNYTPSAENFNGPLYDPLTPFKSQFDQVSSNYNSTIPTLLDENLALIGKGGILKNNSGPAAGLPVTEEGLINDSYVDKNKNIRKIFHAPDGLVYKWKEGIGVLVQYGDAMHLNDPNLIGNQNVSKEPFAGQDVMNTISLLITGIPYNYATFIRAARDCGNNVISNDGNVASFSYYDSLSKDLSKRNAIWGNFIPFKDLTTNTTAFTSSEKAYQSFGLKTTELGNLTKKLQDIYGNYILNVSTAPDNIQALYSGAAKKAVTDFADISSKIASLSQSDDVINGESNLSIAGNNVEFDSDEMISGADKNNSDNSKYRKALRRKVNYLTRRLSWQVRSNEDRNLFIVDDSYDQNYDIIAYEKTFANKLELYKNQFGDVYQRVKYVAGLLELEVFCDTQGNIRVRTPQYNRVPSSIFFKLLNLNKTSGVQILPTYINDLYKDQVISIKQDIEVTEDYIGLDLLLLGQQSRDAGFINRTYNDKSKVGDFVFFSDSDGNINSPSFIKDDVTDPNQKNQTSQNLDPETVTKQANSKRALFSSFNQANLLLNLAKQFTIPSSYQNFSTILTSDTLNNILKRIQDKTGISVNIDNYLYKDDQGAYIQTKAPNIFYVVSDLAKRIEERKKLAKSLNKALRNVIEVRSLDKNTISKIGQNNNGSIPEIYENIIEDESNDDYGPGSGFRYIIRNSQIISYTIKENKPEYTGFMVSGMLSEFMGSTQDSLSVDFFDGLSGGNGLVTAAAVDYDLWRMYGDHTPSSKVVPFFSNPNTQCGPYAAILLSRARKNILQGDITISGNEYMQPGEVVYLEQRNLLFYVTSVTHNFNFGTGFSTSLKLSYGHSPGDYIPQPFDIAGKLLYNNRNQTSIITYKNQSNANEMSVGVFLKSLKSGNSDVFSGDKKDSKKDGTIPENEYSSYNLKSISNALGFIKYKISQYNVKGLDKILSVELRIYKENGKAIDPDLFQFAKNIKSMMEGDYAYPFKNGSFAKITIDKTLSNAGSTVEIIQIKEIELASNDLSKSGDFQSPSQLAAGKAKEISNNLTTNKIKYSDANQSQNAKIIQQKTSIRNALIGYIVDCWVKIVPKS